jgi:quercetin dioxygenase-like cupin family protein
MKQRNQPELPEFVRDAHAVGSHDRLLREALSHLTPPAKAPPQLLRERLLATVARPRLRFAPLFGALSALFDLGDIDLAGLFERAASPSAWVETPIPGARLIHVEGGPRVAGADNGLVLIAAGGRFPMHRHLGVERVLVLDGGYHDAPGGRRYLPGDLQEMPAGSSHEVAALPERSLLFAVSVVTGVDVEGFGTLSPSAGE